VGARLDRVLTRARPLLADGDVVFVAHGHSLRVAAARWLGLPTAGGGLFRLDTATLSTLGYERERPVLLRWNAPVPEDDRDTPPKGPTLSIAPARRPEGR
jgi:probable phosphoglycerate mutase